MLLSCDHPSKLTQHGLSGLGMESSWLGTLVFPFRWSTAYVHEAARIGEATLIIRSQPCKAMRCAALDAGGGMVPVRHPDALGKWIILGLSME